MGEGGGGWNKGRGELGLGGRGEGACSNDRSVGKQGAQSLAFTPALPSPVVLPPLTCLLSSAAPPPRHCPFA